MMVAHPPATGDSTDRYGGNVQVRFIVVTVGGDERGIGLRHTQIRPDLGLLGYGRLT